VRPLNQAGFGSGPTCWKRLRDWQRAGVWSALHELLLAKLREAGELDFSRAAVDSSSVIDHVIARRRMECGSGLGKLRWVVERTPHGCTIFVVLAFALSVEPRLYRSIDACRKSSTARRHPCRVNEKNRT